MRILTSLSLSFIFVLMLAGCSGTGTSPSDKTPVNGSVSREETQKLSKASIGGVHLGDSLSTAEGKFGDLLKETLTDESGYYGDNVARLEYEGGVTLMVDKNTDTILEIRVGSGEYETNLGVKIGDRGEYALQKYDAGYSLFKGANSPDFLKGWYTVEEGELLILDFKEGDDSCFNETINNDDKLVSITLSNPRYFD